MLYLLKSNKSYKVGLVRDFSGRIYEEIKDHLTDFKFELNG